MLILDYIGHRRT